MNHSTVLIAHADCENPVEPQRRDRLPGARAQSGLARNAIPVPAAEHRQIAGAVADGDALLETRPSLAAITCGTSALRAPSTIGGTTLR
jgi:hypothetical protein